MVSELSIICDESLESAKIDVKALKVINKSMKIIQEIIHEDVIVIKELEEIYIQMKILVKNLDKKTEIIRDMRLLLPR